jgi:ssDNA-specific exonuclease RecJ
MFLKEENKELVNEAIQKRKIDEIIIYKEKSEV